MSRAARSDRGVILIFGESRNDSDAVAELVAAANPRLTGRIRALPRPTSLTRTAGVRPVRRWVDEIAKAIRAHEAARGPVAAVLVHRDADGADPDGLVAAALKDQLAGFGGHPVVPVHTIEAWWFLFPDAVEAVRPTMWRGCMPRRARDVERIERPKNELMNRTGASGATAYSEADSPAIARKIREHGKAPQGSGASYRRLTDLAGTLA